MPDESNDDGVAPNQSRSGQPFVWVRDDTTGHCYDVPRWALLDGMTPVEGYELNWTGQARLTKYRTDKAGAPEQPRVDEPSGDAVQARKVAAANAKLKDKEAGQ